MTFNLILKHMSKNTFLVSGANGNLGERVVREFLGLNYQVVGLVRREPQEQKTERDGYLILEADLLNEDETARTVATAIAQTGKIETAVLTAGGFGSGTIATTSISDIEKFYKLNFETAYNIARPLLRHMQENRKGKIFFIGSGVGLDARKSKKSVAYFLSKSLLFQLANLINAEMKGTGVQAHVGVPGTIETPQNRQSMPNADFDKWAKPAEIAQVIRRYTTLENSPENTEIVIEDELKKQRSPTL